MEKKNTWTPGPWISYLTPYYAQRQVRDESEEMIIAVVPEKGDRARCDATARLIAAAPEIAEALEWAIHHLQELLPDSNTLRDCRAALAKARGESPPR